MSVAIVIPEAWDPAPLVRWAEQFARARNEDLLVLQPIRKSGVAKETLLRPGDDEHDSALVESADACVGDRFIWWRDDDVSQDKASEVSQDDTSGDEDAPPEPLQIAVKQLQHPHPADAVLTQVTAWTIRLLILPRRPSMRSTASEFEMERQLFREAPCETMQLRIADGAGDRCRSILVPAVGGQPTTVALKLAVDLADANDGRVTALVVEPNVDEVAELVGKSIAERVVTRALGSNTDRVRTRVVLNRDVAQGIASVRDDGHDLLLLGTTHHGVVHRYLFGEVSEELLMADSGPTVAVVRPALPLASRMRHAIDRLAKAGIPQLDRARRVALVERVQSNSRWDFDFILLTGLSTLIAALGLIQNSAAVVIGAMLVAPLMTPLLAAGLSLVQGNAMLVRFAALSVLRGFLLAIAIGIVVGLALPLADPTSEMLARGSPRLTDLIVAFASGLAAAYAIGRPNLLSALPGVAIAAALVPPIATSGLAIAAGRWELAIGATLLFLTNIVAIVLGSACSLWAVGIRGSHEHGSAVRWARATSIALIVVAVALAIYESRPLPNVAPELRAAMIDRIEEERGTSCVSVTAAEGQSLDLWIDVVARSPSRIDESVVRDLAQLASDHYGHPVAVRLETRLVATSGSRGRRE